jgi:putative transposase
MQPVTYSRHRFPPDAIRHAIWLYLRSTLSYRDVEELLAERGLMINNKSILGGCSNSDQSLLGIYRRSGPKTYTRWHLDGGFNRWAANVYVARRG